MEADLAQLDKKGMPTGLFVTHPISGEKIEVWVGNYVLMAYGEGHNGRARARRARFRVREEVPLPIKPVIDVGANRIRPMPGSPVRRLRALREFRQVTTVSTIGPPSKR